MELSISEILGNVAEIKNLEKVGQKELFYATKVAEEFEKIQQKDFFNSLIQKLFS
jgi:hypothetical protein